MIYLCSMIVYCSAMSEHVFIYVWVWLCLHVQSIVKNYHKHLELLFTQRCVGLFCPCSHENELCLFIFVWRIIRCLYCLCLVFLMYLWFGVTYVVLFMLMQGLTIIAFNDGSFDRRTILQLLSLGPTYVVMKFIESEHISFSYYIWSSV